MVQPLQVELIIGWLNMTHEQDVWYLSGCLTSEYHKAPGINNPGVCKYYVGPIGDLSYCHRCRRRRRVRTQFAN